MQTEDKLNPGQRESVFSSLIHSIQRQGPTLVSEPTGAIKTELVSFIRFAPLPNLDRLTQAYVGSFSSSDSRTFFDYILPLVLYKRYAKHVQEEQTARWSMTRFLVRDPIVAQYVAFQGGLQAQLRSFQGSEGEPSLVLIMIGRFS